MLADLPGAEAADQRQPAGLVLRVQPVDQLQEVALGDRRPALQPDRVLHAAGELDVGAVQLPGAVADPDHVARARHRQPGRRVDAAERLLVLEQQRLVRGVEVDPVQRVGGLRADAGGADELERLGDAVGELVVLLVAGAARR